MTAHRYAGGLKKKLDLRSGSQHHRHFVGFFNVPVLAPTWDHPFYTVIPTHRPIQSPFTITLGIRRTHSRLNPPGPHGRPKCWQMNVWKDRQADGHHQSIGQNCFADMTWWYSLESIDKQIQICNKQIGWIVAPSSPPPPPPRQQMWHWARHYCDGNHHGPCYCHFVAWSLEREM